MCHYVRREFSCGHTVLRTHICEAVRNREVTVEECENESEATYHYQERMCYNCTREAIQEQNGRAVRENGRLFTRLGL